MEIIHLDKLMNQQLVPFYMSPKSHRSVLIPHSYDSNRSLFATGLLDQTQMIGKKVNIENDNTIRDEFYPVGTIVHFFPLSNSHIVLSFCESIPELCTCSTCSACSKLQT